MRIAASLFLLCVFADTSKPPEPAIPYFSQVREVHIAQPDRQNFFIVDQELWRYSRAGLGDLRLYDGETPVQYTLSEQRAGISSDEVESKILNLGGVSGHTEFDLSAEGLAEYDRIRLRLDAHDFVASAAVSGGGAPGSPSEVELPSSTLYDFSKEQLGWNSLLKLPVSSFRFLHIRLSPGIRPEQVKGATIYNLHEQKASWTKVGACEAPQSRQRNTLIICTAPAQVPLTQILLQVAPDQVNFRRTVSIEDHEGRQVARGEISRVRLNHAGILATSEELAVPVDGSLGMFTLVIDNGDNPPLTILSAQPFSLERRIFFDPQGKTALTLYYGDPKLSAPVYDYARFFHLDAFPAEAQLGPGVPNPRYTGRPDDRPWSERHVIVLWGAMILAVVALAILALRGFRADKSQ